MHDAFNAYIALWRGNPFAATFLTSLVILVLASPLFDLFDKEDGNQAERH